MSGKKWIIFIFAGLFLGIGSACTGESLVLETGESISAETETSTVFETRGSSSEFIYIYVCGRVKNPGVYMLTPDSRLFQAVEMAGGVLEEADVERVNLAGLLTDGQKVYIPSIGETSATETGEPGVSGSGSGMVNINLASKETLMTLPGIGEKKAEAIIAYREAEGRFENREALMDVPGIKEGVYEKIKDLIEIN